MKNNPIEISNYIKNEFAEFISSTYTVDDPDYQKQLDNELKSVDLFKGPYLHTSLPFTQAESLNALIDRGTVSAEFRKLGSVNLDRSLYLHQKQAIIKAGNRRNLVITTGTGSGKTESFLYPIINSIMKSITDNTYRPGVKAILLYPMNALVNDQRDRIRDLLKNYPKITFGSYTGDTPEKRDPSSLFEYVREGIEIPENELLSRQEIRNNPPDLLFTNYSMLEYLLIRPSDNFIVNAEYMKHLRFIVLDEAHTYKGTLAIELSYLLKRLCGFIDVQPQYILTSATLGTKKDSKDIVTFAENLTSVKYQEDDIIFASRDPLNYNLPRYEIDSADYQLLENNLSNRRVIKEICLKYTDAAQANTESALYHLLKYDKNVYRLFDAIDGTSSFDEVRLIMNGAVHISEKELVSLIHLVSLANDGGKVLYDAKFHLFVSAPNRAFVTIGDKKLIRFGNHKSIEGYKAFEAGVCRNCNHLYILGNITPDRILEAEDTVDIYENYDELIDASMSFFTLDNQEEPDNQTAYIICSKCGHIRDAADLNAGSCDCGNEFERTIYKVNAQSSEKKNNISRCVYCGQTNNSGIIRSFRLNKDTATSVLARVFYEGMDDKGRRKKKNSSKETTDLFTMPQSNVSDTKDIKQLLAFSDSRQQASFFAVFFQSNHNRILRRRLVWKNIKKEKQLSIRSLVTRITNDIKGISILKSENTSAEAQAWISVLSDLLYIDGQFSSDGIGLYTFEYDLSELLNTVRGAESSIQEVFGLTSDQFINLIHLTIERYRKESAINYQIANLLDQEKKDAFQYTSYEKYFELKKEIGDSKSYESRLIANFLPVKESGTNVTVDYLMRLLRISKAQACDLAIKLYAFMLNLGILDRSTFNNHDTTQVNVERFIAKPYTQRTWFICDKCRKVTPYNINDICPQKECTGHLHECDPDEVFASNFYRREYMEDVIEDVIAVEHTAQLDKEKGREYQKAFKNKKINILSSSTTFEMGVDIGSLENVFLRNVPPSPANYVQRAGRAGRSKDSAALVVTYCGNTSHDFSYFSAPEEMINGQIKPPSFNVNNPKIILRHITASALGMYFRNHEADYRDVKEFVYDSGMKNFIDYLNEKPATLGKYVDEKILTEKSRPLFADFKWINELLSSTGKLKLFIEDTEHKVSSYEEAQEEAAANKDYRLAEYFNSRLKKMTEKENIISLLSEYTVIPKYGFPVDVVGLDVMNSTGRNRELNLQRDLSVAISEYAPDSEVIVDGNKFVSRYINIPKNLGLQKYYYYNCKECGHTEISIRRFDDGKVCERCSKHITLTNSSFLIPELGFTTDKNAIRSRTIRPRRTYAGQIRYLGGGQEHEQILNYNEKINISSISNDQLMVLNEHGFYYCPDCGYTKVLNREIHPSVTERKNHRNSYGKECLNKKLERTALGHLFRTDVIKLQFTNDYDFNHLITLVYALLEGMAKELQIERSDINGAIAVNKGLTRDIILFDDVPGGAGLVRKLMDEKSLVDVLKASYEVVNRDCCDEETTCNCCLRNYYNQSYHSIMKRKYAKEILADLLNNEE